MTPAQPRVSTTKFPKSDLLYSAASEVLATGVSSSLRRHVTPTPLYFERGDGPYFIDVDGHRLLDHTLGWGPLILGNNHPRINAAICEQLSRAYAFGAQHDLELRLAQQIVDMVQGVEQVIFSNSGTEAVQAAIRIARANTGRSKVIKFEGQYHGWLNNVLVSYHPTSGKPTDVQPTTGGQPASEYADTLTAPYNDLAVLETVFENHPGEVAAVLIEPLLANSGSCEPKPGFLQGVVDLCRRHGALSIFDEVITGFRIARGGAREAYQVEPDLSVYGKALAAGFAMSAVGGRRAVFDVLRDGRTLHAGTYNGNAICLAAASATLSVLAEPGVVEGIEAHGRALRQALEDTASSAGVTLSTCGAGAVFSVHWGMRKPPENYRDTLLADRQGYTAFRLRMLDHGVYLLPDGRWYVGAAHDATALHIATAAMKASMVG